MLIEFRVSNFRSIREEQTLSLVASNADKHKPENVIDRDLPGMAGFSFLKGAALYGPNASGKSNILNALYFLSKFVRNSATKLSPDEPTGTEPFKLDAHSAQQPSQFEVTFVAKGTRYLFGLSLTRERVTEEYLVAYPKGFAQKWYRRTFNPLTETYDWETPASLFKKSKDLQEKTRPNAAFLSVGAQWNDRYLQAVLSWFSGTLKFIDLGGGRRISYLFTAEKAIQENIGNKSAILRLLQQSDIGIVDVDIRERVDKEKDLKKVFFSLSVKADKSVNDFAAAKISNVDVGLFHTADLSEPVKLEFENEESDGTKRIFALAGPLIDILENGQVVFMDEIDTSLHPELVKAILQLFMSQKHNPHNAQIIFTTHNPLLMRDLLRRDQIWFTEKARTGQTVLYPTACQIKSDW